MTKIQSICKGCGRTYVHYPDRNLVYCSRICQIRDFQGVNHPAYGKKWSRPDRQGISNREFFGNEKAEEIGSKISIAQKAKWNKRKQDGLLEEFKKKIPILAKGRTPSIETRKKLSESTKKLWENPKYRKKFLAKRHYSGWKNRTERKLSFFAGTERHKNAILEEMDNFKINGFRCFPTGVLGMPIPDFIAVKDGKAFAVEVEYGIIDPNRYTGITHYDDIIWIKRDKIEEKYKKRTVDGHEIRSAEDLEKALQ